jgi:hypothetical protein
MNRNLMLRGSTAPAGYALSISNWLRLHVARKKSEGSLSTNWNIVLRALEGIAVFVASLDDDDPRIRALAVLNGGTRWEPDNQQKAVVSAFGVNGEKPTSGDVFLACLVHAAVLDHQHRSARAMEKVRNDPESSPARDAFLAEETERANNAERFNAEMRIQDERVRSELATEREERRRWQSLALDGRLPPETEEQTPAEPRKLPEGVRKRGSTFQAFWSVDGRQHHKGGFERPEQAAQHRQEQLQQAERAKVASKANTEPQYDDRTTEELQDLAPKAAA